MENKIKVLAAAQNQAALGIINAYLTIYPATTLIQLKEKFPNDVAPDKGVHELFLTEEEAIELNKNKNLVLYFEKPSQIIKLNSGENMALSYIWTKDSLQNLINRVSDDGIEVELISFKEANERNIEGSELEFLNGFQPSNTKSDYYNRKQSLGTSIELLITSQLLDEGREVWVPTVDDHGVDLLVKTRNVIQGNRTLAEHFDFQEIQIKSVKNGGLFVFSCKNPRPNYWFIFFVKEKGTYWLINSLDLVNNIAYMNKSGGNVGKYTAPLSTKEKINAKYSKYIVKDFNKIP